MTNLEVLVRTLVRRALDENQFALERVLDQYEGKPVRGTQVRTADTTTEELIDQQSIALLNSIAEGKK